MRIANVFLYLLFFVFSSFIIKAQNCNDPVLDSIGFAIDYSLADNDITIVNSYFQQDSFIEKITLNGTKDKDIEKFNEEFKAGFFNSFNIGKIITSQLDKGATYDYIGCQIKGDGIPNLMYRLFSDEGLNYHSFPMHKRKDGYYFNDFYVYLAGEEISMTVKRLYAGVMIEAIKKHKGQSKEMGKLSNLLKLKTIKDLMDEQRYEEAYYAYQEMDESAQKEKTYMLTKVMLCSHLSDSIYNAAMGDFLRLFPNDPSVFLVSIDHFYLKQDFEAVLKTVDNLDNKIGGDPFLNLYRGNAYYSMGNLEMAKVKFEELRSEYPGFMDATDSLLSVYIEMGNNEKAIEMLDLLVVDFLIDKEALIESVEISFPDFFKTTNLNEWKNGK